MWISIFRKNIEIRKNDINIININININITFFRPPARSL